MSVETVAATAVSRIAGAINQAARSTGISFEYLLTTARIESNLNPAAQAQTSSAKGLYQFIEQTWLATVKRAGPAHGLGRYAEAIVRTADGHYEVPDAAARDAIMRLRSDPGVSAMMAGAFTRANSAQLAGAIGRPPTEGELYIAHFLGSDGAAQLIAAAARHPDVSAASLFPQAAAANRGIFYGAFGQPRSVGEVYAKLTGRFEAARAVTQIPGLRGTVNAEPTAPDTAGVAQAYADVGNAAPPIQDTRPLFQTMFTDPLRGGVAKAVHRLWAPAKSDVPAQGGALNPLDLFTDGARSPLFRGKT
jgi:hypothetical protein